MNTGEKGGGGFSGKRKPCGPEEGGKKKKKSKVEKSLSKPLSKKTEARSQKGRSDPAIGRRKRKRGPEATPAGRKNKEKETRPLTEATKGRKNGRRKKKYKQLGKGCRDLGDKKGPQEHPRKNGAEGLSPGELKRGAGAYLGWASVRGKIA